MATVLVRPTCADDTRTRKARVVSEHRRFVVVEIPCAGGSYREAFAWDELPSVAGRRDDVIVEMYRQGYTYTQIAKSAGVSYRQVCNVIRRAVESGRVQSRRPKRWNKGA
jgi:DNA-directed RNA polymerase specialized sigma24 family protein